MTDLNTIKSQLPGYFEVIAYSENELNLDTTKLVPAMRSSAIHSFGWPIGIVLEGNEAYKPIYTQKGVRTTIDSKDGVFGPTFDFWELTKKGEFYLLKNLFEDRRGKNILYCDVRIKRIAEALLRIGRLYSELGLSSTSSVGIKLLYNGLKGRQLSAAGSDLFIALPKKCSVENFEFKLQATVGDLTSNNYITDKTTEICSELFVLFDGTVLSEEVYKKVISQFLMKV